MEARINLASQPEGEPLPQALIDKAANLYRVNGCLLVENVFPVELVEAMRDDFRNRYENLPKDEIGEHCLEVGGGRYKFTVAMQAPFNNPELYASSKLLPILHEILGHDCVIHSFGAVCAFPGSEMQHFHKDHGPLFVEAGGLNAFLPPYCLRVHLPMIDLDEACGTTAMWAGSHREKSSEETKRLGDKVGFGVEGAFLPYPKVGDCYLMDFRLSHRGTANQSNQARTVLYILYSRRWFKDHKNFDRQSRLDISAVEYQKIPEEYRDLFLNAKLDNH